MVSRALNNQVQYILLLLLLSVSRYLTCHFVVQPVPAFPSPAKSINPFDINDERSQVWDVKTACDLWLHVIQFQNRSSQDSVCAFCTLAKYVFSNIGSFIQSAGKKRNVVSFTICFGPCSFLLWGHYKEHFLVCCLLLLAYFTLPASDPILRIWSHLPSNQPYLFVNSLFPSYLHTWILILILILFTTDIIITGAYTGQEMNNNVQPVR